LIKLPESTVTTAAKTSSVAGSQRSVAPLERRNLNRIAITNPLHKSKIGHAKLAIGQRRVTEADAQTTRTENQLLNRNQLSAGIHRR
jgi:hypothetical protein